TRHFVGGCTRLCFLPCLFLASAEHRARSAWNRARSAVFSAHAFATGAVPARSVLGSAHRKAANLHFGAVLSAWRLVLFSRCLCVEDASRLFASSPFVSADCPCPKIAKRTCHTCNPVKTSRALSFS